MENRGRGAGSARGKEDRWPSRMAGKAVSEALGQTPRVLPNKQARGPHAPFRASQLIQSRLSRIAGSGYRRMTSSDSARASEALSPLHQRHSCLTRHREVTAQRNGVSAPVAPQLSRPGSSEAPASASASAPDRQMREHPAAVDRGDLKLIAFEENPVFVPTR